MIRRRIYDLGCSRHHEAFHPCLFYGDCRALRCRIARRLGK